MSIALLSFQIGVPDEEGSTFCRKTRMSALNYEFLARPTRMEEAKTLNCDIVKCVINEQCNRCVFPLLSPS